MYVKEYVCVFCLYQQVVSFPVPASAPTLHSHFPFIYTQKSDANQITLDPN